MGLIILIPVFMSIFLILTVIYKGTPIFRQQRPGLNEKPFVIFKFKTLSDPTHENKTEQERLTLIGNFLRKSSLDELPQLWNVFRGDMSLVGPRPLLCDYLPLYSSFHKKRHMVKPGITGWAQVNGRNLLSWEDKLDLDIWYVQNFDFKTDLHILFLTVKKVMTANGVYTTEQLFVERYSHKETR